MVKFIGEDGFYPKWAIGKGRWVHQRVLVITGTSSLFNPPPPPEASRWMVWVPPKRSLLGLRPITENEEARLASEELNNIPFVCTSCGWAGTGNKFYCEGKPINWILLCPECNVQVEPKLGGIDSNVIVSQWFRLGRPTLEMPGAARLIVSTKPITDLSNWIKSYDPMPNELAYVGQQLWSNFATFIAEAQRLDSCDGRNRDSFERGTQGTVFFGTEGNELYAVDALTGRLRWNYKTEGSIYSSPVVANGTVYFGSWDKRLHALDVSTGKLKWSYKTEGEINSTPMVMHGKLYFGSFDGRLYALDAVSGELRWSYSTGGRILCSPAATPSTVYFGSEDGKWYAVDAATGSIKWSFSREAADVDDQEFGYGCIGIANDLVYFLGSNEKLYALDVETGKQAWTYYDQDRYAEDSLGGIQSVVVEPEGLVLCSGTYIGVNLLNGGTGELIWSRKELYELGPDLSGPASIADGVVYALGYGMVVALDVRAAKVIWRYDNNDVIFANFVPQVKGRIVCLVMGKELLALDAMTGDYRWRYRGDEEVSTSPTIWMGAT